MPQKYRSNFLKIILGIMQSTNQPNKSPCHHAPTKNWNKFLIEANRNPQKNKKGFRKI